MPETQGLTDKLDYLQWLGVDCLWLPPFMASPLRDGGYDISDYPVLPEFGTLADFIEFVDAAHERGLRVIIDFVMNHTSDQHAWFQASRSDPEGPFGDFYVWSDTDEKFRDARVIFVDTETSNWTFDPVRKQYFWHRFFGHQPDLNYENPRRRPFLGATVLARSRRRRAASRRRPVPVRSRGDDLREPAGDEFLRRPDGDRPALSRSGTARRGQPVAGRCRRLLRDPKTGGDECHMAFHFPVMPRLFMGVRRESRYPISEIMAQTPDIPDGCQWGIFLRNHDELTLEMVTDEERDYMYTEYAKDPRMKANIGIRRRLAPLLENDRNQLELFTALLLSLPVHRSCTTAMRSAWATTSGSAIATACARRCSGRPTATPASLVRPRPADAADHHGSGVRLR